MKRLFLIAIVSVFASSYAQKQIKAKASLNSNYIITETGLYPEGIDYDFKNERFVFGSMYKGAVYTMNSKGDISKFATSNKLVLPTGVYTDEIRNRLIVANADLGASEKSAAGGKSAGSVASVSVFNLTTGKLIKEIDLKVFTPKAGACANDVALDTKGNIYVTDSFSPIIYKIDINYLPSVFANNPLFQPAPGAFGLNGIVFHPDGYFLVAKTDSSKIFKVSLTNSSNVTEVTGMTFSFPDGLELNKKNELVIIENGLGLGKTYTFSTINNWMSATKVSETTIGKEEFPTTAALASDGNVYVVNSKLGKLFGGDKTQSIFTIQKIEESVLELLSKQEIDMLNNVVKGKSDLHKTLLSSNFILENSSNIEFTKQEFIDGYILKPKIKFESLSAENFRIVNSNENTIVMTCIETIKLEGLATKSVSVILTFTKEKEVWKLMYKKAVNQ